MTRRNFLCAGMASMAAASAASRLAAADPSPIMPLGYNTYCLRSLAWNDEQLLKFADDHKLDAIFLQDSIDPGTKDPKHWREVKARAADHKLHLETGGAAVLPKTPDEFPPRSPSCR